MQDTCRMNIFQPSEELVQEKLNMFISQWLSALDNSPQICLHQITHYVNIRELLSTLWLQYSPYPQYILMLQ